METASVDREYAASESRIRSILDNVTVFLDAAGFDVERDGDRLELTKRVAVAQFELDVELREEESAALAYEQVSGPFDAMVTRYYVDATASGSRLTIETSFDPPTSGFGSFLNSAAIRRQRRAELDAVTSLLEATDGPSNPAEDRPAVETGGK
ncbi:hypothetical protein HWV23_08075 [Natronomonas halophila]|uniref:hypothetical protein n=1 Tax=Natronomonas halophila TaxID=2747817 RepID=UPI0015B763E6|nr:hypothetical protein [Natronomonas halophila]QLD85683.1 hypothetical protein HWV23_08075 [Natronomonas halophila]